MKTKREERLEQIRAAGQHLIDNAETILGDEKYRIDLVIEVDLPCQELPTVTVTRRCYPDALLEGLGGLNGAGS